MWKGPQLGSKVCHPIVYCNSFSIVLQGDVKMRGIYGLKINSRKVIFVKGSRLDLRAPRLSQPFVTLQPGADGDDGKNGIHGPTGRR